MNVFDLDQSIIGDYERFARSFTQIRAEDIRTQVDALYATGRFWPEPLISINPHYERDASVETLVEEGFLHPDTAKIFRVGGSSARNRRNGRSPSSCRLPNRNVLISPDRHPVA